VSAASAAVMGDGDLLRACRLGREARAGDRGVGATRRGGGGNAVGCELELLLERRGAADQTQREARCAGRLLGRDRGEQQRAILGLGLGLPVAEALERGARRDDDRLGRLAAEDKQLGRGRVERGHVVLLVLLRRVREQHVEPGASKRRDIIGDCGAGLTARPCAATAIRFGGGPPPLESVPQPRPRASRPEWAGWQAVALHYQGGTALSARCGAMSRASSTRRR